MTTKKKSKKKLTWVQEVVNQVCNDNGYPFTPTEVKGKIVSQTQLDSLKNKLPGYYQQQAVVFNGCVFSSPVNTYQFKIKNCKFDSAFDYGRVNRDDLHLSHGLPDSMEPDSNYCNVYFDSYSLSDISPSKLLDQCGSIHKVYLLRHVASISQLSVSEFQATFFIGCCPSIKEFETPTLWLEYGCVSLPASVWARNLNTLCINNVEYEKDYYVPYIRQLLKLGRTIVNGIKDFNG